MGHSLGKRIKQLREKLNINQEELAQKLNMRRNSLSSIENDERSLKAEELYLLTKAFNISIDDVLQKLSDMNASTISEYSHQDVPWIVTPDRKKIDYESVFYRTPAYSVQEYNSDDIQAD